MLALLNVIMFVLNLYIYVLIASAILSWLIAFDVVNQRSQFVRSIGDVLWQLTEPALRPIRRILPSFGALDLSPLVLLILIYFIQQLILEYGYRYAF